MSFDYCKRLRVDELRRGSDRSGGFRGEAANVGGKTRGLLNHRALRLIVCALRPFRLERRRLEAFVYSDLEQGGEKYSHNS